MRDKLPTPYCSANSCARTILFWIEIAHFPYTQFQISIALWRLSALTIIATNLFQLDGSALISLLPTALLALAQMTIGHLWMSIILSNGQCLTARNACLVHQNGISSLASVTVLGITAAALFALTAAFSSRTSAGGAVNLADTGGNVP